MALLTRAIVVTSTLLAVGLGLWPLQEQPALAAALAAMFIAAGLLGRFAPSVATAAGTLAITVPLPVIPLTATL